MSRNIDAYRIKDFTKQGHPIQDTAPDVFSNSFDLTWMSGMPTDKYEQEYSKIPIEGPSDDDGSVIYKYNKQGFRCDNFSSEHAGNHILFAGCSQTEGVGGNIEDTWTKNLYNDLSGSNTLSGYFNIARSGFGWQKIINNFMSYSDNYGFPEYLFILLPNIGRLYEWSADNDRWFYVQRYPLVSIGMGIQEEDRMEKPLTIEEHRRCFIDFMSSWKLFEAYLESRGVKMLWATWDYDENINHKQLTTSKNYIDLNAQDLENFILSKRPNGKLNKYDMRRRDGHDGNLIHEYWQEQFKNEITKRGWL